MDKVKVEIDYELKNYKYVVLIICYKILPSFG